MNHTMSRSTNRTRNFHKPDDLPTEEPLLILAILARNEEPEIVQFREGFYFRLVLGNYAESVEIKAWHEIPVFEDFFGTKFIPVVYLGRGDINVPEDDDTQDEYLEAVASVMEDRYLDSGNFHMHCEMAIEECNEDEETGND